MPGMDFTDVLHQNIDRLQAELAAKDEALKIARETWDQIKPLIRDSTFHQKGPLGTKLDNALARAGEKS